MRPLCVQGEDVEPVPVPKSPSPAPSPSSSTVTTRQVKRKRPGTAGEIDRFHGDSWDLEIELSESE